MCASLLLSVSLSASSLSHHQLRHHHLSIKFIPETPFSTLHLGLLQVSMLITRLSFTANIPKERKHRSHIKYGYFLVDDPLSFVLQQLSWSAQEKCSVAQSFLGKISLQKYLCCIKIKYLKEDQHNLTILTSYVTVSILMYHFDIILVCTFSAIGAFPPKKSRYLHDFCLQLKALTKIKPWLFKYNIHIRYLWKVNVYTLDCNLIEIKHVQPQCFKFHKGVLQV